MSSAGKKIKLSTQLDSGTQYETYDLSASRKSLNALSSVSTAQSAAKSVLNSPSFLKNQSVPSYEVSQRQQKKDRRAERDKTKGKEWYNMPAGEMTEEIKNDLAIIKMRGGLHKDRFYKANDSDTLPKYFQMGKIVDDPLDFYSTRIPKRQQKKTILEELLNDQKVKKFAKKHFSVIQAKEEKRQTRLIRMMRHNKKKNSAASAAKSNKKSGIKSK